MAEFPLLFFLQDARDSDESHVSYPSFLYEIEVLQYKLHRLLGEWGRLWLSTGAFNIIFCYSKMDCRQARQLCAFSSWTPPFSPCTVFCHYKQVGNSTVIYMGESVCFGLRSKYFCLLSEYALIESVPSSLLLSFVKERIVEGENKWLFLEGLILSTATPDSVDCEWQFDFQLAQFNLCCHCTQWAVQGTEAGLKQPLEGPPSSGRLKRNSAESVWSLCWWELAYVSWIQKSEVSFYPSVLILADCLLKAAGPDYFGSFQTVAEIL